MESIDLSGENRTPAARPTHGTLELTLGAVGLAAFGVAAGLTVSAENLRYSTTATMGVDRDLVNRDIERRNSGAAVAAITGGVLGLAALALLLWDHRPSDEAP